MNYTHLIPVFYNYLFKKRINNIIIIVLIVSIYSPVYANENELYKIIIKNENIDTVSYCRNFIKKYPSSPHNIEIRLILSAKTHDPYESIKQHEYIYINGKTSSVRKSSFLALLELYFLTAQYDKININHFGASDTDYKDILFLHYLIKSKIVTYDYDQAVSLFKKYNNYLSESCRTILSQALFYKTGIYPLNNHSQKINAPQLYFIAKEYFAERKYEYAFSAYKDLQNKYSRSPEAILSRNRYESMREGHYRYTDRYLLKMEESKIIDLLTPEVIDNDEHDIISYSVVFGPFTILKEVKSLQKELKNDYTDIIIIKISNGYYLYAGNEPTIEKANILKIRLAEEFGLNGKIIQKIKNNDLEYIYGE